LHVLHAARAALGLLARRSLALQLALGLGAVGRFYALVEASEFLADRLASGLRSLAGGVATGRLADRLALGASFLLALVLGATDGADRLLAVNRALSAGRLLALHLAFGALAHRVANGRASGVITLPLALGVALLRRSASHQQHQSNSENESRHVNQRARLWGC
jgi:hypothetical protein